MNQFDYASIIIPPMVPCMIFLTIFCIIFTTQNHNPMLTEDYIWQSKFPYLFVTGFGAGMFGMITLASLIANIRLDGQLLNSASVSDRNENP